jgi:hypothetical protein
VACLHCAQQVPSGSLGMSCHLRNNHALRYGNCYASSACACDWDLLLAIQGVCTSPGRPIAATCLVSRGPSTSLKAGHGALTLLYSVPGTKTANCHSQGKLQVQTQSLTVSALKCWRPAVKPNRPTPVGVADGSAHVALVHCADTLTFVQCAKCLQLIPHVHAQACCDTAPYE